MLTLENTFERAFERALVQIRREPLLHVMPHLSSFSPLISYHLSTVISNNVNKVPR